MVRRGWAVLVGPLAIAATACSGDGNDTTAACEVLGAEVLESDVGNRVRFDALQHFVEGGTPTVVSALALTVDTVGPVSSARAAFDVLVSMDREATTPADWDEIAAAVASLPGVERVEVVADDQIVEEYETEFGPDSRVAMGVAAQIDAPAASAEIRVAGDSTITERLELLANGDERITLVHDLDALRDSVQRFLATYTQRMIDPVLDEVEQLAALDFVEAASAEALVGVTFDDEAELDAVRDDVERLIRFSEEECGLVVPPPS